MRRFRLKQSRWVRYLQVRVLRDSEEVAPGLAKSGVVRAWFGSGFRTSETHVAIRVPAATDITGAPAIGRHGGVRYATGADEQGEGHVRRRRRPHPLRE